MRRLPPRQQCPGCGREHRAYDRACSPCRGRMLEEGVTLAAISREQREGRRQETLDTLSGRPLPVPYNEFPPGF